MNNSGMCVNTSSLYSRQVSPSLPHGEGTRREGCLFFFLKLQRSGMFFDLIILRTALPLDADSVGHTREPERNRRNTGRGGKGIMVSTYIHTYILASENGVD